jgi:ribosome biogenesis GTPase
MPGLRSLGLDVDATAVAAAFSDVDALAAECRFADCRHEREPGCAVTAAEAEGMLDAARMESYRKLQRELAFEQRRHDPIAKKEATKVWKARTKEYRKRPDKKR